MAAGSDKKRRADLIEVIRSAFAGVSREGGTSWSDSFAEDGGPAEDCPLFPDRDRDWTELIDDPRWVARGGWGGFSFLDAIGARYYLPVALVRVVRDGECEADVATLLRFSMHKSGRLDRDPRWQLLSDAQWRGVLAVADYMSAIALRNEDDVSFDEWTAVAERVRPVLEPP